MWDDIFRTRLSPLACQAGQKRLKELEARLGKRDTQNPLTALIQEWLVLSTEMTEQRTLHRNIFTCSRLVPAVETIPRPFQNACACCIQAANSQDAAGSKPVFRRISGFG